MKIHKINKTHGMVDNINYEFYKIKGEECVKQFFFYFYLLKWPFSLLIPVESAFARVILVKGPNFSENVGDSC